MGRKRHSKFRGGRLSLRHFRNLDPVLMPVSESNNVWTNLHFGDFTERTEKYYTIWKCGVLKQTERLKNGCQWVEQRFEILFQILFTEDQFILPKKKFQERQKIMIVTIYTYFCSYKKKIGTFWIQYACSFSISSCINTAQREA